MISKFDRGNTLVKYAPKNATRDEALALERAYYEEVLQRVIDNPRFYLDNLGDLDVFRCSFVTYIPEKKLKVGHGYY